MQRRLSSLVALPVLALQSAGIALALGCGQAAPSEAAPPVAEPVRSAVPHAGRIVSFALSRDGALLATGSEDDERSVVLWDVRTGAVLRSIDVEGGVGLADCLLRGVAFSADGRLVGFNYDTSSVGVAEVATGRVVLEASTESGQDSAPSWAFSDDGSEVVIAGPSAACPDAMGVLFAVAAPHGTRCVAGRAGERSIAAIAARDGRAHVVSDRALVSGSVEGGTVTATDLIGAPFLDGTPSPGRRFVAIGHPSPNNDAVALYELDSHRLLHGSVISNLTGFAFAAADETRWAAVRAEPGRESGVVLLREGIETGRIAGPLEARELQFADGLPFSFSPDGSETIVLRPGGGIERAGAAWARVPGAHGLAWPIPGVVLAIGPDVIVFLRAGSGEVLRAYGRE